MQAELGRRRVHGFVLDKERHHSRVTRGIVPLVQTFLGGRVCKSCNSSARLTGIRPSSLQTARLDGDLRQRESYLPGHQ